MNSDKFAKVKEIYTAVLDISPDERDAYLSQTCGDDEELRNEIDSLLAYQESADSLIDAPPDSLAAEIISHGDEPDYTGAEIEHYKIVSRIGRGGMGEVYLAEDVKLRRKVALKILPIEFAKDNERKKRFEQEALAVSSLNHPNVITIYGIEEAENISFMATEFVDGHTLRSLIAERSFSWREAVNVALQITSALESAHSVGIIHRDIKPANIMIRDDGIVKVLDFGLAKLTAPKAGDFDARELTAPNRVMGTINYMSPEQALRETIDSRTDIFSFGVVLYEMLTGKLPFGGAKLSATDISAIDTTAPSITESNDDIPRALDQIVKRALEKDRNVRYQTITDLRSDLKRVLRDSQTDPANYTFTNKSALPTDLNKGFPPNGSENWSSSGSGSSAIWLIAPLMILGLAVGAYWVYSYVLNNAVNNFQSTKLDVLTAHGSATLAAISPDGKYIVYTKNEDGKESLWLRQTNVAGDSQIALPDETQYSFLKFSPDGNFLYVVASEGKGKPPSLYQMTTLGRNRRKLITGVDSKISFSPDGRSIAFIRVLKGESSVILAEPQSGSERILRTRKEPEVYGDEVSWSPDGKTIAVPTLTYGPSFAGGIAAVDVSTGTETPIALKDEHLLRVSRVEWLSDGSGLIFSIYVSPMGERYQLRHAAFPSGEIQNLSNDLSSYEDFSLTADSKTMVAIKREYSMGIWLTAENDFSNVTGINSKTGADDGERGLTWTKDGKVVFVSSEGGAQNIWRMDADGSNAIPLTTGYDTGKLVPSLSIGGDLITFFGETPEGFTFFQMNSDGQDLRRMIDDEKCALNAASANETWIVYTVGGDGKFRIWKVPLKGGAAVKLTDVDSKWPVISPDGKSFACYILEKGQPTKLALFSMDGGSPLKTFELPSTANISTGSAWNKNGDAILFVNTLGTTSNIWAQPLNGAEPTPFTAFKEFQIAQFALNSEGTRLAVARGSRNSDIVLIKNIRK